MMPDCCTPRACWWTMISPWWARSTLDRRSLWLNFEITLLIDNPVFVAEMNQLVQGYMLEATPCR